MGDAHPPLTLFSGNPLSTPEQSRLKSKFPQVGDILADPAEIGIFDDRLGAVIPGEEPEVVRGVAGGADDGVVADGGSHGRSLLEGLGSVNLLQER